MIVKILWTLVGINIVALLVFIGAYFVINQGKHVDSMERGWTIIFGGLGLLVILLAAVPLKLSQSTLSLIVSGTFASLPLAIVTIIYLPKMLPSLKRKETFANTYYLDKTQQAIASSIENNDTTLLKELIKGQNLNIQGIRVWDWPGLNCLQFAVRIRSNPINFPFDENANDAAIRILLAHGADPQPALAEATKYLSPSLVGELLAAGANPNVKGFVGTSPLLFELIGTTKQEIDMAILLVQKGADPNAKNDSGFTPVMHASRMSGTTSVWIEGWRFVRYLLIEANVDYEYSTKDGQSLGTIIRQIRNEAAEKQIAMSPDFDVVVQWLKEHHVDTEPLTRSEN